VLLIKVGEDCIVRSRNAFWWLTNNKSVQVYSGSIIIL